MEKPLKIDEDKTVYSVSASIEIDGTIEANTKEDAERAIEEMLEIGGSRAFQTGEKKPKDRLIYVFEIRDVSEVNIESME